MNHSPPKGRETSDHPRVGSDPFLTGGGIKFGAAVTRIARSAVARHARLAFWAPRRIGWEVAFESAVASQAACPRHPAYLATDPG